jgi:hypothetical protein
LEGVARTTEEGDRRYAPGNWMKGCKEFFVDCLGHAIEHFMLCAWDEEKDIWTHLSHTATNIAFILWALASEGKVTGRDFQRAAVIAQDEKREAEIQANAAAHSSREAGMLSMKSSSEPLPTTTKPYFGYSIAGIPLE